MPLPIPIGRQKDVLYLPAYGHVAVLGTAGSGKTTLAILRSAYLADPATDHHGRTLLVTFNRALRAFIRHSQDRALASLDVENYHHFARGYLASRNKLPNGSICSPQLRNALMKGAITSILGQNNAAALSNRRLEFFVEEIQWLEQHGIQSVETYVAAERIGRATSRVERTVRPLVYQIYEEYRARRGKTGRRYDWDDLATAVRQELELDPLPRRYRHVVIDEGQDFSPEMIRSLVEAVPADGSVTFFADVAQQIYGHRMSWRSSGLRITSPVEFKENYRNTKQIAQLALAVSDMPYYKDIPDLVEPRSPTADGPRPVLVSCLSDESEIRLITQQARGASSTQSVAILFRHHADGAELRRQLPSAVNLVEEREGWHAGPGIHLGTFHAAKGLEFDTVIIPYFTAARFPDPLEIAIHGEEEASVREGRLLYVGVTRARSNLIITYTGIVSPLLPDSAALFQIENA